MRTHSFYDLETGEFTGRVFSSDIADEERHAALLAANTPKGSGHVEGAHDHRTHKVDLSTGAVVELPAAAEDAEEARAAHRGQILQQIAQLESSQHRAIREVTLGTSANALERLREIDEKIAELRAQL